MNLTTLEVLKNNAKVARQQATLNPTVKIWKAAAETAEKEYAEAGGDKALAAARKKSGTVKPVRQEPPK